MTSDVMTFSAANFRHRVLSEGEGVAEREDGDNGDHVLNPGIRLAGEGIRLKDAAVLVPVVDYGDEARVILRSARRHFASIPARFPFPVAA